MPDVQVLPKEPHNADFELLGRPYPLLGTTPNARFYLLEPDLVAVVPVPDAFDNAETSRASITLQESYFQAQGVVGSSVIFIDRVLQQDRGARQNYKLLPNPELIFGFAIVTESILGRAISSLFLGLAATRVPTRVFANLGQAVTWLKEQKQASSAKR
jgi:hypothetical protein